MVAYVNVDFDDYCRDCTRRGVARGQDSIKEAAIRERWSPTDRGALCIDTPRTIVDRSGIIMAWILPGVLLPRFQVCTVHCVISHVDLQGWHAETTL